MTIELQNGGTRAVHCSRTGSVRSRRSGRLPASRSHPARETYSRHLLAVHSDPSAGLAVRVEGATGGHSDGSLHTLRAVVQATPDPRLAISGDYTVNRLVSVGTAKKLTRDAPAWPGGQARCESAAAARDLHAVEHGGAPAVSKCAMHLGIYQQRRSFQRHLQPPGAVPGLGVSAVAPSGSRQLLVKLTWLLQL